MKPCGCKETLLDVSGQVARTSTCPLCLPAGAITWLIENGRQLDMFEVLAELPRMPQVDSSVSVSALVEVEVDDPSSNEAFPNRGKVLPF